MYTCNIPSNIPMLAQVGLDEPKLASTLVEDNLGYAQIKLGQLN